MPSERDKRVLLRVRVVFDTCSFHGINPNSDFYSQKRIERSNLLPRIRLAIRQTAPLLNVQPIVEKSRQPCEFTSQTPPK
jgi:hypothetical protein